MLDLDSIEQLLELPPSVDWMEATITQLIARVRELETANAALQAPTWVSVSPYHCKCGKLFPTQEALNDHIMDEEYK